MSLKLYNTAERKIVPFVPLVPGQAALYCCGPTVYNFAHIGNLRTYIFEDVLRRTLEYSGFKTKHVMNVTDVGHLTDDGDEGEDKMIKGAREQGMSVWDIANHFTQAFFVDIDRLNILRPEVTCKATDHIADMIALIQRLEAAGFTYTGGGNVYFDTARFPTYGKMALLDKQDAPALSRVDVDNNKKNPRDFVLWFTKGKFEGQAMVWDSPWGRGYPGWHIECSAMSMKYLGERFDLHCGGVDHIPVHHTNEIAQSEAATGHSWVNYWIHGEFLQMGNSKMSKSGGKFVTVQTVIDQGFDPLDYRYFCLGGHYRTQLSFTWESLEAARTARRGLSDKVVQFKQQAGAAVLPSTSQVSPAARQWLDKFREAIFADMNMPMALAQVWGLLKEAGASAAEKLAVLYEMDQVLGLRLSESQAAPEAEVPADIQALAEERQQARKSKNFARSDEIRDQLKAAGWVIEDTPAGPKVKKL